MQTHLHKKYHPFLLTLVVGWVSTGSALRAADFVSGETYFGHERYIEYQAGDLPLVLSAPHGGHAKPDAIPNRTTGTFAHDTGTLELAHAVAAEFHARTGRHLHLVVCRLHRLKVDCNREIVEAAAGNPLAERAWKDYHHFLKVAGEAVEKKEGRGFFIDLHGHGHEVHRVELGYLHGAKQLRYSDAEIDKSSMAVDGSLRAMAANKQLAYSQLLRGPSSLGALLEQHGFPASPSPTMPHPAEPFFAGGYTVREFVRTHAASAGLQIETNYAGIRDTHESRARFAKALADSLEAYLDLHAGLRWTPKAEGTRKSLAP